MKKRVGSRETLVAAVRSNKMLPSEAIEQYLREQKLPYDIYDLAFDRYGICGCCVSVKYYRHGGTVGPWGVTGVA